MAVVSVTHKKVVSIPDDPNYPVGSNEWNDNHNITGLENVDNTSDVNKPVSTAQAAAIAAGVGSVTKTSLGLGNVDNTADANKPVSTAQAAAITSGVASVTKASIGLGSVDNTSDVNKPVSTAQAAADAAVAAAAANASNLTGGTVPTARLAFVQSGTGAVTRTMQDKARDLVSVKDFGAVGDGVVVAATVSIASGAAALTATGATFTAADVGKSIVVPGAGAAGAELVTTILSFTDATHVTLAANAGTTLSAVSKAITYGTDDAAALQAWITYVVANHKQGYLPAGKYLFGSALSTIAGFEFGFFGSGRVSELRYIGTSKTVDLITLGDGTNPLQRFALLDFTINSSVKMTAGAAIRPRNSFMGLIDGVIFGDDNLAPNLTLYVGVWWDHFQYCIHINSGLQSSFIFFRCNDGAGLALDNVRMLGTSATIGLQIGGGVGGFYLGYVEIFGHDKGVLVDNSLSAAGNNQIFISNRAVVDTCVNAGYYIADNVASNKSFIMAGWCASTSSASGNGFLILNWNGGTVSFTGAQIVSNVGNGINILDTSAKVFVDASTVIWANGTGVAGSATSNLYCDAFPVGNTTNFGANYRAGSGAFNAAWSSFTSTVGATGGAITSATCTVKYAIRGKRCEITAAISVSNNGTGSGTLTITLPSVFTGATGVALGREGATSGKAVTGTLSAGPSLNIQNYDNTYPVASGSSITLTGIFELA